MMASLNDLADRYVNYLVLEKGLSEKTVESYTQDLSRYLEFLNSQGILNITQADNLVILKYLIGLRDA